LLLGFLLIRIAFVIPTLDQSGAERQLTLLAGGLPRNQYEPHVIALNRGGHYADVLRDQGIPVHVLGKRFRFDPLTWWRLRSLLHRLQPQIVQSFIFAANSCVRLPGVCPPNTKVIVSERCVDVWKSDWQRSLDRKLAGRMHMMTANSESVAAFYRDEIGITDDRLCVIPNGIPDASLPGSGKLHQELGLPVDCRIIGFVGRLAPQKNLRDLVWGFHLIKQAAPSPVALVMIGEGPQRDGLAQFLTDLGTRDLVHFLGHRDDASELMQDFSVFCLPSAFEGMSNSLMEAMACGIPSVVSDIPPNLELIRHEENGLTFPVGKAPDLARAVLALLQDDALSQRVGQAAQELIVTEHNVAKLVLCHEELYQQLLSTADTASELNPVKQKG
jgi:glycosyltransferase involved in cell wall biosynthesis